MAQSVEALMARVAELEKALAVKRQTASNIQAHVEGRNLTLVVDLAGELGKLDGGGVKVASTGFNAAKKRTQYVPVHTAGGFTWLMAVDIIRGVEKAQPKEAAKVADLF